MKKYKKLCVWKTDCRKMARNFILEHMPPAAAQSILDDEVIMVQLMYLRSAFFGALQDNVPTASMLMEKVTPIRHLVKRIFFKVHCDIDIEGLFFSNNHAIRQLLLMHSCEADFSRLICPFSVPGTKSTAFILRTIRMVEHVFKRTKRLWAEDTSNFQFALPMIPTLALHEALTAWTDARERSTQYCILHMEALLLEVYYVFYLPLTDFQKKDPDNRVVRQLFLSGAFYFALLNPRWDQSATLDWLEKSLAKGHGMRSDLFQLTMLAMARMARVSEQAGIIRYFTTKARREDLPTLQASLRGLADLQVGTFHFERLADLQQELQTARGIITLMELEHGPAPPLSAQPVKLTLETWTEIVVKQNAPKKKLSQAQRRKRAKQHDAVITSVLDDICRQVARDYITEEIKQAKIEHEVGTALSDLLGQVELEAKAVPRQDVLADAKAGSLPAEFARSLAQALLPGLESALDPIVDCFVCLQPIDFGSDAVRFLACCEGGSFACGPCTSQHPDLHPLRAEWQIVRQTASVRRSLRIGAALV